MKPHATGTRKRPCVMKACGAETAPCFQEELIAAIHGAFEVAVDIVVREVKTLLAHTTSGTCAELRRENESLRQKLQKAEAMLDSARVREDREDVPAACQLPPGEDAPHPHRGEGAGGGAGVRGAHPDQSGANPDLQDKYVRRRSDCDAGSRTEEERSNGCTEVPEDVSCEPAVKVEAVNPARPDPAPSLSPGSESTSQHVAVKQEEPEEEISAASCCLDFLKVEDSDLEAMGWSPGPELTSSRTDQEHPPNLVASIAPPDLQSISSEFPNRIQPAEPAVVSQQVYGVQVRTGRSAATVYTCKFCGQTFQLPSLLRRHYGQCQQRLLQRCPPPLAGGTRTRLQLYPPGCSPFRCSVCNREFNRMENLKTHLRIHTGERPYTCSVCAKCFRHSGALTRHFRIHTGEKPYVCGQCGKSFRNCGGLKFHQRSHSM